MKKIYTASLIVIVVASLLMNAPSALAQAQSVTIPTVIQSCIEPSAINTSLIAQAKSGNTDYYWVVEQNQSRNAAWIVITVADGQCRALSKFSDSSQPLSAYVPQAVARQLAMNKLQHLISLYGRDQYQKGIDDAAASIEPPDTLYIDPDEVWAGQQLGITFPSNMKILMQDQNFSEGQGR